jgi:dolichyl-phosphate-mannose-protein mannosyltransferase
MLTSEILCSHCLSFQEVSCYVDHNVSMPAQDVWRVEITNREEIGDVWHALESMVEYIIVFNSILDSH